MARSAHRAAGIDRRPKVEDTLARYPYIDDAELQDLLHWFRKEATAVEVALLTSEPALIRPYQRFKAEHLDRVRGAHLFWGVTFVGLVLSILVMVAWTAT